MNWKLFRVAFLLGLALFTLSAMVLSPLSSVLPGYVQWLDETLLVLLCGYLVFRGMQRGLVTVVGALASLWLGYTVLSGLFYLSTQRTRVVEVRFAGVDERNAGRETAFVVDLADENGVMTTYMVRDLALFPWVWNRDSGEDRRLLRTQVGKKVCVRTAGIRAPILSLYPTVLEVYNETVCEE